MTTAPVCTCTLLPSAADPACPRHGEPKTYDQLRRELDRLHTLVWRFVDAHRIPAKRASGEDRLLLNVDPDLWREAADLVGYDEQGQ